MTVPDSEGIVRRGGKPLRDVCLAKKPLLNVFNGVQLAGTHWQPVGRFDKSETLPFNHTQTSCDFNIYPSFRSFPIVIFFDEGSF